MKSLRCPPLPLVLLLLAVGVHVATASSPSEYVDNPAISEETLDSILAALGEQPQEHDRAKRADKTFADMPRATQNTSSKFLEDLTFEHNRLRRLHGTPDLVQDSGLNEAAQAYANYLGQVSEGRTLPILFRKGLYDVGANLWATTGRKDANHISPTFAWYNEERYFTYGQDSFCGLSEVKGRNHVDHFTQMIWGETRKIGCAKYKNKSKHIYVVCLYSPAGNVRGHYLRNVPTPTKAA